MRSPFEVPPEEDQVVRIIADYQRKILPLEEAAPLLRDALKKLPRGINLAMSPSIRRLFAEAEKLDGRVWPEYKPDPNRHVEAGREMLETLEAGWVELRQEPRIDEPFRIDFQFAASNEETARAIAKWLRDQGQEDVKVYSPTEADSDDWSIHASTPATRWSEARFNQWVAVIGNAPVAREGSFSSWSY